MPIQKVHFWLKWPVVHCWQILINNWPLLMCVYVFRDTSWLNISCNTWGNYSKNTTRPIAVPCQQHSDFVSLTAVQWGHGLTCDRTYFLAPKGLPFASSKEQSKKKKNVLRIKCNVFLSSSRSFCNCCWFTSGSKLFHVWGKPFRSLCNEHLTLLYVLHLRTVTLTIFLFLYSTLVAGNC